jgi:hypothetical protein
MVGIWNEFRRIHIFPWNPSNGENPWKQRTISLDQFEYIREILKSLDMESCKSRPIKLWKIIGNTLMNIFIIFFEYIY